MTNTTTRDKSNLCRAIRWMVLAVWALGPLCPLMADEIWVDFVQDDTWRYSYRYNNTKDEGYATILGLVDQDSPHEDLHVPATAMLVIKWLDKSVTFGSGKLSLGLGSEFGKGLKCCNLYVPVSVLWGGQVKDAEIEDTVYVTGSSPDLMTIGQGVFSGATMKHVDFQCNVRTVWDRYDWGSFCDCPNLLSFSLRDGCRLELGQNSFLRCPKLSMTEIPEGVMTIGNAAFAYCHSLVDVKLPSSVTNLGENAFERCANLRHIDFGASLRSIGYQALYSCSNLLEIVIPDSVTSIGRRAFDACVGVTNISLGSGWNPLGERLPGQAESLDTLTLRGNGEMVLGNYAFAGLKMRRLALKGVARIDDRARTDSGSSLGVCHGCLNLKEIVYLDDALTSIGEYAFAGCVSLKEAVIPDSVTSVGYSAYVDCTSLTNIWIGAGWNPNNGGRFPINAESLDTVAVCGNGETTLTGGAFGNLKMRHLVLDGVKLIGDDRNGVYAGVFQDCPNLEEVVFRGDVLTSIGTSAFADCTALKRVHLPNSLTNVANRAFNNCSALEDLDFGQGVQRIDCAFQGCCALKSLVIPDSVTAVATYAFDGCTSLSNIWIGAGWNPSYRVFPKNAENLDSVTVCGNGETTLTGGAFGNLKMRHLVLDGVKLIGDDYYGVYAGVFQECPNLEEVVFRGDALASIGTSAFAACTALKRVCLPSSLTSVANNAFKGCTALAILDVAAGDRPLTIESGAFTGCGAFASVTASVPAKDGGDAYDVTAYVTGLPTPPFGKVTIQPELDPAKVTVRIGSTAAGEAALRPTSSADGTSLAVGVESAIPGLYYVLERGTDPGEVSAPDVWKQATSAGGLKLVSSPSKDAARFFRVKARLTAP